MTFYVEYRSREAIFMAILRQINKGQGQARITEIMYKVFLSHFQLRKYMAQLLERGIITTIPNKMHPTSGHKCSYILTDKGVQLLGIYEEMHKMVPMLDDPSKTNTIFK